MTTILKNYFRSPMLLEKKKKEQRKIKMTLKKKTFFFFVFKQFGRDKFKATNV